MIKLQDRFGEFLIKEKLSAHHDGEREVYLAEKGDSEQVVLTVFSLDSTRYGENYCEGMDEPCYIEELWFLKEHAGLEGVPTFLDWGLQTYESSRYAWMTQSFVEAESLNSMIWKRGHLTLSETVAIARAIGEVVKKVALFTGGGGHYNLSVHNILVRYDGLGYPEVFVIGFTNLNVKFRKPRLTYRPVPYTPPPIDLKSLDKRVAPSYEMSKGTFNTVTDVYELGMLTFIMLAGYPAHLELWRRIFDYDDELMEMDYVNHAAFRERLWFEKSKMLTSKQEAALKKATHWKEDQRMASIDEFLDHLRKIENEFAFAKVCANYKLPSPSPLYFERKPHFRRILKKNR